MTRVRALVAAGLYGPEEFEGSVAVAVEGSRILAVWPNLGLAEATRRLAAEHGSEAGEVTDLGSLRLAPGYIDLHTHGFAGAEVTSGTAEDISRMAAGLPATGVTAFFPTIASTGRAETAEQVRRLVSAARAESPAAAEILGVRLEGPFISRAAKGAQDERAIRPPDVKELEELASIAPGWIKILDYAPEEDRDGRLLQAARRLGILACIGHTTATYEQALNAIEGGATHCTHLFNAMPPLNHRAPGAPGALLTDRRTTAEMIPDGIHLHPAVLKLALAARGPDAVAIITDAISAAGGPPGDYLFAGRTIHVRDGAARLDDGTLAGSALTVDRGVRNMVNLAGCRLSDAIRMATLTPARIAGVDGRKGRLTPGADADLVALDAEGNVHSTWTRGKRSFSRQPVEA
jgi:N-acetylglucosamine-6-phosphate deacetylase